MTPASRLVFLLACLVAACPVAAGEVHVAVAANFAAPMARIATAFTATTGHGVKVSTGSTGRFATQIAAGAPFDVLLAADDETPRRLGEQGHALAASRFTYAIGRLVLWSATPGMVDPQGAVLASGRFRHLALANPRLAPYGAAAMQVLRARGLQDSLAPRLVTAESIAQAFQFVSSGNAELGFVALSQLTVPGQAVAGSFWLVPAALHSEIRQDAILLKAAGSNPAAAALLDWLKGSEARAIIRAFGYTT